VNGILSEQNFFYNLAVFSVTASFLSFTVSSFEDGDLWPGSRKPNGTGNSKNRSQPLLQLFMSLLWDLTVYLQHSPGPGINAEGSSPTSVPADLQRIAAPVALPSLVLEVVPMKALILVLRRYPQIASTGTRKFKSIKA